MSEHEEPRDEVELPEDGVEDLEPEDDDADDVTGGAKHIGNVKYSDL